jgi:uncharacterized membrane protein required for colicin V production
MDQISTSHIIDLTILAGALLFGVAGFWRGVAKEVFTSAGVLLGYVIAFQWSGRWGGWLDDQTRLSIEEATFAVSVATLLISLSLFGYGGSGLAGLPPADFPGRVGGLVLATANGVVLIAIMADWARRLVLSDSRVVTLRSTEVGRRLSENTEWVVLAASATGFIVLISSWQVQQRRLPIVSVSGAPRPGESGFRLRRGSPLAPEPVKIERQAAAAGSWSLPAAYTETAPLTRVPDPSSRGDRPSAGQAEFSERSWRTDDLVRCVACGERIGDDDRFCPRCGRQLT